VAHLEHRLCDVDLVDVQVSRKAFEIPEHLEAGDPEPARAHSRDGGGFTVGMTHDVGRIEHDLGQAGRLYRAQFGLQGSGQGNRVHPEVVQVHRWLTTSSKVTPPR
jgi:hypothetical protein